MTPNNSIPKTPPPRAPNPFPYGSWEWMVEDEERSLDRMHEALKELDAKNGRLRREAKRPRRRTAR
jgi:hypothetical protein